MANLEDMHRTLNTINSNIVDMNKTQIEHGKKLVGIETKLEYVATREDITDKIETHITNMHKKTPKTGSHSYTPKPYNTKMVKTIIISVGAAIAAVIGALAWVADIFKSVSP